MHDEELKFFVQTLKSGFRVAEKANDLVPKNLNDDKNEIFAGLLLNQSISLFASAKAMYVCFHEEFARLEIDNIFSQFDAFSNELLTNITTNHSHQWTGIEFERLQETMKFIFNLQS